ncbi:abortive infection family protein [Paracoccus tibetensis]|uniref:Abortive infection C-terminus n=1 Tax=Paracoccus tibetensis TaxID=336292 RepID=A0A1G5JNF3_9RHOB|nr:abortive infection family protein [Paracoccus tibetensis]SCY89674.1 Abortive infection C-terminus [Paracoccus tibetensis]
MQIFVLKTPYEQLIPRLEREVFEKALDMESGYVLDFSDRTFNDFFFETVQIDPSTNVGLFIGRGTSKAKRLRCFIEKAQPHLVAKVLRELWEYRDARTYVSDAAAEEKIRKTYFNVIARFEGRADEIDTTGIEAFEPSVTLEELVAAIRRDLDAKKPQAALDRLHTYCMKRFASLVRKHGGGECGRNDPLHSRVAKYVNLMKRQHSLTPMSEQILNGAIENFKKMNPIRNDQSLAHDNETLVSMEEARFIFDSVTAFLRFSKAIDGRLFKD